MRICHVTRLLPPDQGANALLPYHLGCWSVEAGDEVVFAAHPPSKGAVKAVRQVALPGRVTLVPPQHDRTGWLRSKLAWARAAFRAFRALSPLIAGADLVHVHGNGSLAEIGAFLATRKQKPFVLTVYGNEIWHYQPRRFGPDLFQRAYRRASHVTFYSHGLLTKATELGLARHGLSVIYPPVPRHFAWQGFDGQMEARAALGLKSRHVLLNVKSLQPLAGHRYLIEAVGEVIRTHPDLRLVICGTGPLLNDLRVHAAAAGVSGHVVFAGLIDNREVARYLMAADIFVLPSLLEACPTVALEALACGTPVVSSDSPGGMELNELFGPDVTLVARSNMMTLAAAIVEMLDNKRRTHRATAELIERDFRPEAVAAAYRAVYRQALEDPRTRG
jgi:glycosyltransferase involved in cell wall biosynthesis